MIRGQRLKKHWKRLENVSWVFLEDSMPAVLAEIRPQRSLSLTVTAWEPSTLGTTLRS